MANGFQRRACLRCKRSRGSGPAPGQCATTWEVARESPMLTSATALLLPSSSGARCVFMAKMALIAALGAILLMACGYSPSACDGSGTLPVQTSPSPGLGFDAVVTETDKAITIQSGQKLEVVLHARSAMTSWSNVRASDTSGLSPIPNTSAMPVRRVTPAASQPP